MSARGTSSLDDTSTWMTPLLSSIWVTAAQRAAMTLAASPASCESRSRKSGSGPSLTSTTSLPFSRLGGAA